MNEREHNQGVRGYLTLAVILVLVLLASSILYASIVWRKPDYWLFFVPSTPIFWAFLGGLLRVLHGLTVEPPTAVRPERISVYTWAVTRPIIGAVMGAFVYLALTSGLFLLDRTPSGFISTPDGRPVQGVSLSPVRPETLNAVAFVAGFSDRFSIDILERISGGFSAARRGSGGQRRRMRRPGPDNPPE